MVTTTATRINMMEVAADTIIITMVKIKNRQTQA